MVKRDNFTDWTIRGFHWDCSEDGSICVYGFSIAEESSTGPPKTPSFCHFVIHGEDDETAVRSPFIDVPCEGIDNYRCGASWSDNGYMVFTIDNIEDSRRGYFGIPDSELQKGSSSATHHSPAYVVLPSAASVAVIRPNIHTRDDVPNIANYDIATDDSSNESTATKDDASNTPKHYTIYENDSSQLYTIEGVDVPADASQSVTEMPDINLSDKISNLGAPIEAATQDTVPQDIDGTAVASDVELDTQDNGQPGEIFSEVQETATFDAPVDTPADAPVAASVDTVESLPQTVQDAIQEQLASVPGNDDDANGESITSKPVSSIPIYSDGLPTVPESPITWSLRNVTRDVSYEPNAVLVSFLIDILPDGEEPIPCHIKVDLGENIEPMFASWFVEQCEESDWYFSWGYNEMTDSAVATLINPDRTMEAWYGWDSVNSLLPNVSLASVGPGIVQTCDC